ncbi:MAG: alpha/beta hydrolase [Gammaproteobacteria bacterium]|nr:alpha/beta hydrolase [Gammaproteobacteria bacterium]
MNQRRKVVFMPGLDGTGKLFTPIIPLLDSHFDLSFITYPDLNSFSDYIECAQNQLPPTAEFSLVAESLSSPVALALMAQQPDQIGPSVLSAGFARSPLAAMTHIANHIPEQMFSIGALSEFWLDVQTSNDQDFSETQPLPLNVTEQIDGEVLKHRLSVMSRIDVSALLPSIEIPILYLRAVHDRILSEGDAQMMQQLLPNVKRVDIDAPHLLLQTQPQQCAELIVKHIQSYD